MIVIFGVHDKINMMTKITFAIASKYRMPFGKYFGQTLDDIARTDEGLLYLDYLRGERQEKKNNSEVDRMLAAYLNNPSIARDLYEADDGFDPFD